MEASPTWHGHLALAYLYSGRVDEASAEFDSRHESATTDAVCRVYVSAARGRLAAAQAALAEVERDFAFVASHSECLASVHAAVGDRTARFGISKRRTTNGISGSSSWASRRHTIF